jgi:hypothetical protein
VNDVFVTGLIAGWAVFVAGCWLNFQLLRQNGRMLLRLAALEKRIEKFEPGREDESERLLLQGANDYAPVEQSRLDSMRWVESPRHRDAKTQKPPLLTRALRFLPFSSRIKLLH